MSRAQPKRIIKPPTPIRSEYQPTFEERMVIERRVMGFLTGGERTLKHVMIECYLQGMRDTLDAQGHRG